MNYQPLINQAEDFVKKYIHDHDNPKLVYHNLSHTRKHSFSYQSNCKTS